MLIETEETDDALIATPVGPRIESHNVLLFKEALRRVLDQKVGTTVVDLAKVEFIDSSGLGSLVAVAKLVKEPQQLHFTNLSPLVSRVFELTHMEKILNVLPPSAAR